MIRAVRAGAAVALAAAAASLTPVRAQPQAQANLQGIWDFTWATRHGPQQKGYLRIDQQGSTLRAQIHGQGSIDARGKVSGRAFEPWQPHARPLPDRGPPRGRAAGGRAEGAERRATLHRRKAGRLIALATGRPEA